MNEKLALIESLYKDFKGNAKVYAERKEINKKEWAKLRKGERTCSPCDDNYMNKNCGKTALKRKIIYLRQELLNLSYMLED